MTAIQTSATSPRDIARALFRHRRKMLIFFAATTLTALAAIALYPRSYGSQSKLFIRIGRESVGLDPTATTGETVLLQKTQVDEINSALDLLTGRAVFSQVVERVGADRILTDSPAQSGGKSTSPGYVNRAFRAVTGTFSSAVGATLQAVRLSDPGSEVDRAIRRLESRTRVWAPKDSTVITVKFTAASPELARDVVDAITKSFIEQHVRLSQTDGSMQFFSDQVDKLFEDLSAAEAELRDTKNAFQLTSSGNRASIIEKSKEGMRQKIFDLQLQEIDLQSRYTKEHPWIKELRRQREEAEASLAQMPTSRTDSVASRTSSRAGDSVRVLPAVAVSESSAAGYGATDRRSVRVGAELQMLNDQELQLVQLERKVQLLDTKYRMHVEKLEQARVNDALGRGQITNVKIAQPATLVTKPESPKKAILLGFGLITAVCGAIGLAFVAESSDKTLRTAEQVEVALGVPVLMAIPDPNSPWTSPGESSSSAGFRTLARDLMPTSNGTRRGKTVGIIGCDSADVRSKVAGDLAIQVAQLAAEHVLLIDADAQQRHVARRFNINGSAGWNELLAGAADAKSCIQQQQTNNLAVMGPGGKNGRTHRMPTGVAAGSIEGLRSEYDLVVVDLPPTWDLDLSPADLAELDEALLVVDAERTLIESAHRVQEMLVRAGVHLKGVVLANQREHIPRWLDQRL